MPTYPTRGVQDKLLHLLRDEAACEGDVDGRLHLVARQHPQLNARRCQLFDALRHALLQLILNGSASASEIKNLIHFFINVEMVCMVFDALRHALLQFVLNGSASAVRIN